MSGLPPSLTLRSRTSAAITRVLDRVLPNSLLGRLSVVMIFGVLVTQLAGGLIWAAQLRTKSEAETRVAAQHLAHSASGAIRYFMTLPANYRPIMIQQLREMGARASSSTPTARWCRYRRLRPIRWPTSPRPRRRRR